MRVLVDLSEDDLQWLDQHAREQGKSRAAVLREAVSSYRTEMASDGIEKYYGIWKDRADIGDAVEWQRRLRAESAREWDSDYQHVKKEFPDLFSDDGEPQEAAE